MTESAPTDDSGAARSPDEHERSADGSGEARTAESGEVHESPDAKPAETPSGESAPGTWAADNSEAFGEGSDPRAAGISSPHPPPSGAWPDPPAGLSPGPPGSGAGIATGAHGQYPSPGYPAYRHAPYPGGYPPAGQAPPDYPVAQFGRSRPTNTMAIISLVLGILGLVLFFGVASIPAVIVGHIARKQIRQRDEEGDGIALAGLIMGWIGTGLLLLFIGFLVVVFGLAAAGSIGH